MGTRVRAFCAVLLPAALVLVPSEFASADPDSDTGASIDQQPVSTTVTVGGTATFTTSLGGSPYPDVCWQTGPTSSGPWTDLVGDSTDDGSACADLPAEPDPDASTSSDEDTKVTTLTLVNVPLSKSGLHVRAQARSTYGDADTDGSATLTVDPAPAAPSVSTDPIDQSAAAFGSATFASEATGVPEPTVQWQYYSTSTDDWADLATDDRVTGVTTNSLSLSDLRMSDSGLRVRARFSNSEGSAESTEATLTVDPATLTKETPSITGTVKVGSTLTARPGTWTAGTAFTYSWLRNGAETGRIGSTYKLGIIDVGAKVSVRVTGTLADYRDDSATSSETATVPPVALTASTPVISGIARVGTKLTAKAGTWTSGAALRYQWRVDSTNVSGATQATFTPRAGDAGKQVSVRVTGSKTGYTTVTKWSKKTANVAKTTIGADRYDVLERDPVTLSARSSDKRVLIERSLDGGSYKPYLNVATNNGKYSVKVKPIAGRTNRYRVGTDHVTITSITCTPSSSHGSTNAWFNVRKARVPMVALNWSRAICTAARGSTIDLASMFIFGGTTWTNRLIDNLDKVATHRGVHVNVLVESSQFASPETADQQHWTYKQFKSHFKFAQIHSCEYGCAFHDSAAAMHMKFMTISRTTFGGSVVVESTLNWSEQQFARQNGSAMYYYNRPALHDAFVAAFDRAVRQDPPSPSLQTAGWISAGSAVAYAFDPSTIQTDPIATELGRVSCVDGGEIDVVNANVTRSRLVKQLNRLSAEGCSVRVITEQLFAAPTATYTPRHMRTHDKFVLVSTPGLSEVMTGAENFRPALMTISEEQLVRDRHKTVVDAYKRWFEFQWAQAT